jgi:monothiol glutaredoxin
MDEALRTRLTDLIKSDRVVLFMKGTRHFPQCGFSATVVQILDQLVPKYQTVNVLKEPEVREGIKELSSWPTIPQLYVDGEFVGGCDIVREMFVAGELHDKLGVPAPPKEEQKPPAIELTQAARDAVKAASEGQEGALRLGISTRFEYELSIDEPQKGDFEVDAGGVKVLIDRDSAKRGDGIKIDYSAEGGGGFRIDNPNEPARVKQIRPAELKALQDRGEKLTLVDVRSPQEQELATLGGRLLDRDFEHDILELDKSTPLVFYCHTGMRSQAAAEHFVAEGFKRVYNLAGGIDAWSREVDRSVPTY